MIDLSIALSAFAVPGGITVLRREPGATVDGMYIEPEPTETRGVQASVQPASGEDLELLEEGARKREAITAWTKYELRTALQESHPADRVVYQGSTYEVMHVRNWGQVGGYWKAVAVRVDA